MASTLELLLINNRSCDPFSTLIIDPHSSAVVRSFKGSESSSVSLAVPIGLEGDHLALAVEQKPTLHLVGVDLQRRVRVTCTLPGPISSMATHPNGAILTAAIEERIYTWMLSTGQLLTIIVGHYQPISKVAFSSDGSILVSVGKDGVIKVWNLADLLTPHDSGLSNPHPIRVWSSAHSLPIADVHLSKGGPNCRILTCSTDQTACLHSIASGQCLLRVLSDTELTACTIDPAETRLFLASINGAIAQINLYSVPVLRERHMTSVEEGDEDMPLFKIHKSSVACLNTNQDGSFLVSGDISGLYCIWDIQSRQCLKSSQMKGAISTCRFIPYWPSLSEDMSKKPTLLVVPLQKQLTKNLEENVPVFLKPDDAMRTTCDKTDQLLASRTFDQTDMPDTVEGLKLELEKAKKINQQLYGFAVDRIVKKS